MEEQSRRVLVPLEGSESDMSIVALASVMAERLDAELVLVRVVQPSLPPLFQRRLPREEQTLAESAMLEETERAIRTADVALRDLESSLGVVRACRLILVSSDPATRVIEWLRAHPVALVVAAVRPLAGVAGLLQSSIAERVARNGLAPVVTVRCQAGRGPSPRPAPGLGRRSHGRCAALGRRSLSRWRS